MKIGFFGVIEAEKKDYFSQNLGDQELAFFEEAIDENSIPEQRDFEVISVFVDCQITPHIIDAFPNLKHIAVRSTGFDNVDTNYAKSKNILVTNVPAYGSHTVAEFTFGLILSLSRKIPQAAYRLKVSAQFSFEGLRGFDLNEKTLGVIGTGKIGANVIKIAKGFGMNILACDYHPNEELAKTLGFTYTPLEEVLKNSDIVTIHAPYTPETHHLINKNNIFLMKKGSFLINTARGAIVETESLFQAITQNHLAGAAMDVLEVEGELKEEAELLSQNRIPADKFKNILEDHLLMELPQVIITPHMAFYTKEAEMAILQTTVENIKSIAAGTPQNVVNP